MIRTPNLRIAVQRRFMPVLYAVTNQVVRYKSVILSTVLCGGFTGLSGAFAQEPIGVNETLVYLNGKLEGKCETWVKKQTLHMEFYNSGGAYRKDEVLIDMLDPNSVEWRTEDNMIVVRCHEGQETCVWRKIYRNKKETLYNRFNVVADLDEKSGKAVEKAFKHLIKLHQFKSYSSNEPFE